MEKNFSESQINENFRKKVKCPKCNSNKVSILYDLETAIVYCQNSLNCKSIGEIAFLFDKKTIKLIKEIKWT